MKAEIPFSQSYFKFIFSVILFSFLLASTEAHNFEVDGSRGLRRGVVLHGTTRVSYGNFAAKKFHRLQDSAGSSTVVSNYRECALNCVNTVPCSSFNVASSPDSNGKFVCELLNKDKCSSPNDLVSSQNYHHFSIKVRDG